MIAVVSDGLDPAPDHTLIASVSDYLNFVRSTNNIAYRNMNVVDMVQGLPGTFEFEIRCLVRQRDRCDLHSDLARSLPGLRLRIRGPRKALEGAVPVGLKLIGRQKDENLPASCRPRAQTTPDLHAEWTSHRHGLWLQEPDR